MDATKSFRERRLVKSFVVMASQNIIRNGANGLEFSVLSSIRGIAETGINSLGRIRGGNLPVSVTSPDVFTAFVACSCYMMEF